MHEDEDRYKTYSHYMSFYLLLAIAGCGIAGFSRFMNYTIVFYLVMLSEFIYNIGAQVRFMPLTKAVLLSGLIFFNTAYYSKYWPETDRHHYEFFVPYTSILNEDEDISYREDMYKEATTIEEDSKNARKI